MIIGRSSVLGLSIPLPISSDMGKSCVGLRSTTKIDTAPLLGLESFRDNAKERYLDADAFDSAVSFR